MIIENKGKFNVKVYDKGFVYKNGRKTPTPLG